MSHFIQSTVDIRFYQSLIDSKLLPTSISFEALPDVITIWILPYDPFGDDRMLYTVKNTVAENNQIVYNDGILKLFLYTRGTKGGSKELKDLLTFLETSTPDNAVDSDLSEIQDIINKVKSDSETRKRYMGIMGVTDYEKRDALIQGAIDNCKFLGLDREKTKAAISKQFSLPERFAEEFLNLYW